jgi:hypothetical protein
MHYFLVAPDIGPRPVSSACTTTNALRPEVLISGRRGIPMAT